MWVVLLIICIFGFIFSISNSMQNDKETNNVLQGLFENQENYLKENNLNETAIEYIQGNDILDDYFDKEKSKTYDEVSTKKIIYSTFLDNVGVYVIANPSLSIMLIKHILEKKVDEQTLFKAYMQFSRNNIKEYIEFKSKMYKYYEEIRENGKSTIKKYVAIGIKDGAFIISNFLTPLGAKLEIPLDNIMSYSREGDVFNETHISGGGGGGSSLTGAVVGGVVAGSTGAIIGSRKKTEEIKSENIIIDKRTTILEYKVNNEIKYLFFGSDAYEVFLKLIPNKQINFVQRERTNETNKTTANTNNVLNQIKSLSDLREQGILTEEEFIEKKKMLLAKI